MHALPYDSAPTPLIRPPSGVKALVLPYNTPLIYLIHGTSVSETDSLKLTYLPLPVDSIHHTAVRDTDSFWLARRTTRVYYT